MEVDIQPTEEPLDISSQIEVKLEDESILPVKQRRAVNIENMDQSGTNVSDEKILINIKVERMSDEEGENDGEIISDNLLGPKTDADQSEINSGGANYNATLATSIEDEPNMLRCQKCFKGFKMAASLNKHECSICEICGKVFINKQNLRSHFRSHLGEKPYECEICGNRFTQKHSLKTHSLSHRGEKPYDCAICGKKFIRQQILKKHMQVHTDIRPYECGHCGKKYFHKKHLSKHVRVHTGEKPYSCSTCGRRFAQSENLKTHVRTHIGDQPFTCELCNRRFSRQSNLQRHVLLHTSDRPYACALCDKKFTQQNKLDQHVRVHSGEKPFYCELCGKNFTHRENLKTHVVRVHYTDSNKPYSCRFCGKKYARESDVRAHIQLKHGGEEAAAAGGSGGEVSSDLLERIMGEEAAPFVSGESDNRHNLCGDDEEDESMSDSPSQSVGDRIISHEDRPHNLCGEEDESMSDSPSQSVGEDRPHNLRGEDESQASQSIRSDSNLRRILCGEKASPSMEGKSGHIEGKKLASVAKEIDSNRHNLCGEKDESKMPDSSSVGDGILNENRSHILCGGDESPDSQSVGSNSNLRRILCGEKASPSMEGKSGHIDQGKNLASVAKDIDLNRHNLCGGEDESMPSDSQSVGEDRPHNLSCREESQNSQSVGSDSNLRRILCGEVAPSMEGKSDHIDHDKKISSVAGESDSNLRRILGGEVAPSMEGKSDHIGQQGEKQCGEDESNDSTSMADGTNLISNLRRILCGEKAPSMEGKSDHIGQGEKLSSVATESDLNRHKLYDEKPPILSVTAGESDQKLSSVAEDSSDRDNLFNKFGDGEGQSSVEGRSDVNRQNISENIRVKEPEIPTSSVTGESDLNRQNLSGKDVKPSVKGEESDIKIEQNISKDVLTGFNREQTPVVLDGGGDLNGQNQSNIKIGGQVLPTSVMKLEPSSQGYDAGGGSPSCLSNVQLH